MKNVGNEIVAENANWDFSGKTVKNFDIHIKQSVPMYEEGQNIICNLSDFFVKNDSVIYDLGTSTGEVLFKLAEHNKHKGNAKFIGIDCIEEMIEKAITKQNKIDISNIEFQLDNILEYDFEKSDLIVSYYTIQFIRPSERQRLIDKIYKSLKWGGAFIIFEKVRGPDARFQDIITSLYKDYKISKGFNADEILSKERSLKGVLEPFSTQGNLDMLKRAGFIDIMTIMKYINFEGFIAIK